MGKLKAYKVSVVAVSLPQELDIETEDKENFGLFILPQIFLF